MKDKATESIVKTLKRAGASCDSSGFTFTIDEKKATAVKKAFIQLYNEGLIYRGDYVVNCCPRCKTVLSYSETLKKETTGKRYRLAYPIVGEQESLLVETSQPETLFGDSALVINPGDKRYKELSGKKASNPLSGEEIPIIQDSFLDSEAGTGVFRLTPAHNPDDFEVAQRHNLKATPVFTIDGVMNKNAGEFAGLDQPNCRKEIVKKLNKAKLLVRTEETKLEQLHCLACHSPTSWLLSPQWFVRMKPLARPVLKAVDSGDIDFFPRGWKEKCLETLQHPEDWCISRQYPVGDKIPAWYCENCGEYEISLHKPETCTTCHLDKFSEEKDLLDTSFSLSIWPLSVSGWSGEESSIEGEAVDILVTPSAHLHNDVLKQLMISRKLAKTTIYKKILVHGEISEEKEAKKKKGKAAVETPVEMMDKYGGDALRLSLASLDYTRTSVSLIKATIVKSEAFLQQVWNAGKIFLPTLSNGKHPRTKEVKELCLLDRWILSKFDETIFYMNKALEKLQFREAQKLLKIFIQNELTGIYFPVIKKEADSSGINGEFDSGVLSKIFDGILRLSHPFIPFITEELWRCSRQPGISILHTKYPSHAGNLKDDDAGKKMKSIIQIADRVKSRRKEIKIDPSKKIPLKLTFSDPSFRKLIENHLDYLTKLADLEKIFISDQVVKNGGSNDKGHPSLSPVDISIPLSAMEDAEKEKGRLSSELSKLEKSLKELQMKLSNQDFLDKAPDEVIEKSHLQREKLLKLHDHLKAMLSDE